MTEQKAEQPKSIVEVLRPRAQLVAELITKRITKNNLWTGYTEDEELAAELRDNGRGGKSVHFSRKKTKEYPQAVIVFDDIELTGVKDITVGEPNIAKKEEEERDGGTIVVAEGTNFKEDISHTFSKTTNLSQAVKVGAEASVKATVGAEYAGVKGSLEVAAKISTEYNRQWGEGETTTDTVNKTLDFQKPGTYTYEAVRSLEKIDRKITATTSFAHDIHFLDEHAADGTDKREEERFIDLYWSSFETFIAVAQGLESTSFDLYHAFMHDKITSDQAEALKASGNGTVEYVATYDNVKHQDITIKKES